MTTFKNNKEKGEISEACVIAAFKRKQWAVLIPFGDNERYDLVIDRGDGFERVQVKSGSLYKGSIRFFTRNASPHASITKKTYEGEVDLFAVYSHELNKVYIVPIEETGSETTYLRIDPVEEKHHSKVNKWASDYELS